MSEELPSRIGDVLGDVGKRVGIAAPLETGTLWARWAEIVGAEIAAHAEPSSLRDGVLRIRADSPAWATEIGYLGEQIRRRANDATGRNLVTEVRVWTGPGRRAKTPGPAPAKVDAGSETGLEPPPKTDDPSIAFDRARSAWARRSGRRSGEAHRVPENKRKSW